ncbi:MAG: serine/threonine-protein kinase PknK, partial [Microcoleaceae cyanobacterium]
MNVAHKIQQKIAGYQIIEQLYSGSRTLVYRAISLDEQHRVILKILQNEYSSFDELVKFRNQYTIAKNLNLPGIIRTYTLEPHGNRYVLVMEDFGGISLAQFTQKQPLDITTFLAVAIQIADILDGLYQHRVIHKDIKPANILIHPDTKQVKLIDFSISSLLPRETQEIKNPNILEGTLAYISPEQTGRMNRGIDYRTDFYSLGITLYELLTGQLPFDSNDPMELVHCHLAKTAAKVDQINPNIPTIISQIIAKLMAKNAENRYQSAWGLKQDLQQCLTQWKKAKKITEFVIAQQDICDRFIIPEKLYGRSSEVQSLLNAFARVASRPKQQFNHLKGEKKGVEMMLVSGFSGIGKTAVINEVHKPIIRGRGYFIKGKFDGFNRNIPFSAFVQAFRDLINQLLGEPDSNLQNWKTKILNALGENAQVIIQVIPELEKIIGSQPSAPELSGSAAQNRFNLLFNKFVGVFTTEEHPLVIFLDDLQWADSASLNLLKLLMNPSKMGYLLIVGAYRDNEVGAAHPLMLTLADIQKQEATINTITLTPLDEVDIRQLVADTLFCSTTVATPLAQLVYQKTQGNPFFTTQFLQGLYHEGCITFNPPSSDASSGKIKAGWQCNLAKIRQISLTDDVVKFIIGRLKKLPEATQNVLKLAACIGNQFDLATLAVVCEDTQEKVAMSLWRGLQEGFVIPENETYKFFQGDTQKTNIGDISVRYRFVHDRVQQAAYCLIPEGLKQAAHYYIGQLLLQQTSPEAIEESIFTIVGQLNYGITLIIQQTERNELAKLNLIACRKARSATAYQAGREYANTGLSLLGETAWENHYEITLEFHELAAELAYLSGEFEVMQKFIETTIEQAQSLLEQVNIYRIRIQSKASRGQLTKAIIVAQQFLQQLGLTFPETPTPSDIEQSIAEINQLIGEREVEDLVNLPVMADRKQIAMTQTITSILPTAYMSGHPLFPLLVTSSVKLSIQSGNISVSALAYASYGIIVCSMQQDVNTGVEFGHLALQLVSKLDAKAIKPEIFNVVGLFLLHRTSHLKKTLPLFQQGYTIGLEMGNLEQVAYSASVFCLHSFFCAQPLENLAQETQAYCNTLTQLKQLAAVNWCSLHLQIMLNLLNVTENPTILFGETTQETEILSRLLSENNLSGLGDFYLYKLILSFLFEDIVAAIACANNFTKYLIGSATKINEPVFYYYDSLAAIAGLKSASDLTSEILQRVEENQTKLQHKWAKNAPMNHQHKVDLVEAEKCKILGKKAEAIELYDRAIALAKENGYTQEEALGNELAAKFYLAWNKEIIASSYMIEAYYCYSRWGAKAKVAHLETHYPQ